MMAPMWLLRGGIQDVQRICLLNRFPYRPFFTLCDYWRDPSHEHLYLRSTSYLTYLNNQVVHTRSEDFKRNFLDLERLVLIGGPKDGVVSPWQSAFFGFFDSKMDVKPFYEQGFYINDTFGLRTLERERKVNISIWSDVKHSEWLTSYDVYKSSIKPFLH